MTDPQDPFDPTVPASPPAAPLVFPWEAKASRHSNAIWWLIIAAAAIMLACLVMLGVVLNSVLTVKGQNARREEAGETIDRFMTLMKDHQEEEAYQLFSLHARQDTSLEDFKKMNQGSGYQLVQGYRRVVVTAFQVNPSSFPGGERTASVSGQILYSQHESGQFSATLEEEGDDWKLLAINISPVPDVNG